ncbi:MAG: PKD domain-containing protein [Bacteroidetes bacterium]|mgnify:FL=1|nr:PKD domain-containing protein [Bacteroidota bacterium]MBT5528137.1 PKD domain-containing protein [Cytophagia bacterium]MBT3935501.1 PKD domain-containing protein [Bacteroidota bacterium]MBT4339675.1 PKD domain-containing protein [Bacteroidota bacterium]MBT4728173.1 PKD domain-containing protein [Bacteroidota bacterium]
MIKTTFIAVILSIISFLLVAQPIAEFSANITSDCNPLTVKFTDLSSGNPTSFSWNFGNGQTSVLQNPTISYTSAGKYTVSLKVTSSNGSSTETKTQYITVFKNPIASLSSTKQIACIGQQISFSDISIAGDATINQWYWDFGDGGSSSLKNPSHAYSNSGVFSVTLIVTDANNCTGTYTKTNYIEIRKVDADFASNQVYFCNSPAQVNFLNISSPNSSTFTYQWDFGDAATSTSKSPTHSYTNSGKFTVKLKITDAYGCIDELTKADYIVVEPIIADFFYKVTDYCHPANAMFSNASTPSSGMSFLWDFGDGSTSASKNPSHIYQNHGTYTILLTANYGSCQDTISRQVTILQTPSATFSADTQKHCKIPFQVKFSSNSTTGSTLDWDLGNGNTSTIASLSTWYTKFGSYDINLTVSSSNGCSKKYKKPAYIISQPPLFYKSVNPKSGCVPLTIHYVIYDSSMIPLTIWKISSGDGQTKTTTSGSFTYQDTGVYTMTLSGRNNRGCSISYTETIKVGIPPVADFEYFSYSGCNKAFQFNNLTNTHNPKADGFSWDFGDGTKSNDEHPIHKFQDTGFISIILTASLYGCSSTIKYDSMLYILAPIARLTDPRVFCASAVVRGLNNSIGGNKWYWDFGDNSYSTKENPDHIYSKGTYQVKLVVWDTITGCVDSVLGNVYVLDTPKDDFTAFPLENCSSIEVAFSDTSTQAVDYFWEFGDGGTARIKSPKHYYVYGGAYDVSLKITNAAGCDTFIVKKAMIKISDIKPNLLANPGQGCVPVTMSFIDNARSAFPIIERKWNMGDGGSFYTFDKDTSYTYFSIPSGMDQSTGYDVVLKLQDSLGCYAYSTKRVYPTNPKAIIYYHVADQCKEAAIKLGVYDHDTLINSLSSALWYFNGNYAGSGQELFHYFSSDTIITAKVVVTDVYGCQDSAEQILTIISRPPKADFAYTIQSTANNCPPVIVHFQDKSIPGSKAISSYFWDFGNASTSTHKNPSNTYREPGLYSVSLIVKDVDGCEDTLILSDIIRVNGATGYFHIEPLSGCDSLVCEFTPITSKVKEYSWSFGDGSISHDSVVIHQYTYPGKFYPVLIMEDSLGCKTSIETKDTIYVYKSPIANFQVKGKMTCVGHESEFINLTWHEQEILSWTWYLGNGQIVTAFEPSFTYIDTGKYSVSLVVVDDQGCYDSVRKENIVHIYYDTINPTKPFLYKTTHIIDPLLDEVLFSANADYDFKNFKMNRADYWGVVKNSRYIQHAEDTLVIDTLINGLIPQCYYIQSLDYCNNQSDASKLHCLINLKVTADSLGNHLNWTPYVGWNKVSKYELFRKDMKSSGSFNLMASVDGSILYYLDTNINCSDTYFYQVKAYEEDGHSQFSFSNVDDVVAAKHVFINAIELLRVSVENEMILIEWEKADIDFDHEYLVFRSTDNIDYQYVKSLDQNVLSYTDDAVNTSEKSYYYRIYVMHKNCYFISKKSNVGKSILLKINKSNLDEDIVLTWSHYQHWEEGVNQYEIHYSTMQSPVFTNINSVGYEDTVYIHQIDPMLIKHAYKVRAIRNLKPDIISNSNIVVESIEPSIFVPNSFTPNGDGLNDYFSAKCYGAEIVGMQIFNRWGELIFESAENNASWDGYFKNKISPLGVYYYNLQVKLDDELERYAGTLSLLR